MQNNAAREEYYNTISMLAKGFRDSDYRAEMNER